MTDLEKLAIQIMKEAESDGEPVTKEEAMEMAEMELKSKEIKRYEQADKPKERKPREKKIDLAKKEIIEIIAHTLIEKGYSAEITNIDKTIDFDCYTVTLTKHRAKKG